VRIFAPTLRNTVCAMMAFVLAVSASTAQTGPAMLYSQGGVRLNGVAPPAAIAIFPGDLVQTDLGAMAKIAANGSGITIQGETVATFEGGDLALDHGRVVVDTSQSFGVRVGCLTIVPVRIEGTGYDVTDRDGQVEVVARKSDININRKNRDARAEDHEEHVSVREGEHQSRQDKCAAAPGQSPAASLQGPILDSQWVKGAGIAGITALTCWVLCRSDNPVSPNRP
jgi:hypothetical protein